MGIEYLPILALMPLSRKRKEILLVQEKPPLVGNVYQLMHRFEDLNPINACCDWEDIERVREWFENSGFYKAGIIRLNSLERYDKKSLETLAGFSVTPVIVDEEKYLKALSNAD